jgi:nucleoid-associated protein YgaU
VRPGDCLWSIAESVTAQTGHSRQVASYWARLVEANRDVVADPDLIFAGQVLVLPPLQPDSGVGSP